MKRTDWESRVKGILKAEVKRRNMTYEQLAAKLAAQRREGGGDRRLGDNELIGGGGHRPAPHHREKRCQLGDGYSHGAKRTAAPIELCLSVGAGGPGSAAPEG